jgi:hypothetical protein
LPGKPGSQQLQGIILAKYLLFTTPFLRSGEPLADMKNTCLLRIKNNNNNNRFNLG